MTRVLPPDLSFGALAGLLANEGWSLAGCASAPTILGEPEHAVFERAATPAVERMVYTFNPVCMLRVLDGAASTDAVQGVDAGTVRDWLAGGDERTVLRGILAAAHVGDPALAPLVEAHRTHPRAAIADCASRASRSLRAAPAGDSGNARLQALAAIELLRAQLAPLLQALPRDEDGRLGAALRPRAEDYALAFRPEAASAAQAAYEAAWRPEAMRVSPLHAGSRLHIDLAPAGMLADDNQLSRQFPGGFRAIAHLLQPQRIWARWKYTRPGEPAGMVCDGLVWLDDHWAWFPRPYRVLAP